MGLSGPAQGRVGVSHEFRQRTILSDETPSCGGTIQLTITTIMLQTDRVHAETIIMVNAVNSVIVAAVEANMSTRGRCLINWAHLHPIRA